MYVCVCVLSSGWCTRRPDLSTANATLPIFIYNFVRGVGSAVFQLLVPEEAFYEQSAGFSRQKKSTQKKKKAAQLLVALPKRAGWSSLSLLGKRGEFCQVCLRQENFN